jgi:hypothetical protein
MEFYGERQSQPRYTFQSKDDRLTLFNAVLEMWRPPYLPYHRSWQFYPPQQLHS